MATFEGCPGSRTMDFNQDDGDAEQSVGKIKSLLGQWPIHMHLISPTAPYYQGADVVLTADCVAYALGDFHREYLKGKSIAIACPKLDSDQDIYLEKIKAWFDEAKINTLTVLIMQVEKAAESASRKVPTKCVVVGVQGEILQDDWV